jgi:GT2 family glycosyltransferase
MITVVYCTIDPTPEHTEHLKKSSGVKDIEVIEYINKGESLTKFYNQGLKEAKNDIVVFCHNDITLNTKNWGKKLIKHFNDTDYGILGVAGTTDMADNGTWWTDNTKMMGQVRHSHEGKSWDSKYCSNFGDKILETIIVDGLFFAVKKDRLANEFNEEFEGFHFYEIDFCFSNHLGGAKVGVTSNIRVTHKSIGMTNDEWEQNRLQFVEKYKDKLPYNIKGEIMVDRFVDTPGLPNHAPYRVSLSKSGYPKMKKIPKVGVIIPTKGNVELLTKCVDSIYKADHYGNIVTYIADTGSTDKEKEEINSMIFRHGLRSDRLTDIRLIEYDYYNFAKINNDVVWNHIDEDTELLLFCNNDVELVNEAITRMVMVMNKHKNAGTIGARLHFGNGTLQHGGIAAFLRQDRKIGITHKGLHSNYNYPTQVTEVFGNTAAFMMIRKDIFNKIGGFNQGYLECFEDVELNIDCLSRNLKNYFVPDAVCYHYESQTRNKSEDKIKREGEDYTKRLIPYILTNKKCYDYFENISAKDLELIVSQTVKKLV